MEKQVKNTGATLGNGVSSFALQPAYDGIKDVLRSVYKEGGMRGLYRGVGECAQHPLDS